MSRNYFSYWITCCYTKVKNYLTSTTCTGSNNDDDVEKQQNHDTNFTVRTRRRTTTTTTTIPATSTTATATNTNTNTNTNTKTKINCTSTNSNLTNSTGSCTVEENEDDEVGETINLFSYQKQITSIFLTPNEIVSYQQQQQQQQQQSINGNNNTNNNTTTNNKTKNDSNNNNNNNNNNNAYWLDTTLSINDLIDLFKTNDNKIDNNSNKDIDNTILDINNNANNCYNKSIYHPYKVNMTPCKWIWMSCSRTLPNTILLFRKTFFIPSNNNTKILYAIGFISADSRYRLYINNQRIQWGTSPCDPRNGEIDPIYYQKLQDSLNVGAINTIAIEVLFYGHGDGTWPGGQPGLLFYLSIQLQYIRSSTSSMLVSSNSTSNSASTETTTKTDSNNTNTITIISDNSWYCTVHPSYKPGQYKRWFLRSLQEQYDNRYTPQNWKTSNYTMNINQNNKTSPRTIDTINETPTQTAVSLTSSLNNKQQQPIVVWDNVYEITNCTVDKPISCRADGHWCNDSVDSVDTTVASLRLRETPISNDTIIISAIIPIAYAATIQWYRNPTDYFDMSMTNSYTVYPIIINTSATPTPATASTTATDVTTLVPDYDSTKDININEALSPSVYYDSNNKEYTILNRLQDSYTSTILTYEFTEQIVGWPIISLTAPAGTIVEIMVTEATDPTTYQLLNNHYFSWIRFICRDGHNTFESFDYESLRWIQLNIRTPVINDISVNNNNNNKIDNNNDTVIVHNVQVRRKMYNWTYNSLLQITSTNIELNQLFHACSNTITNFTLDTLVDGVSRERQQYSGDMGHVLHGLRYGYNEYNIINRYIRTWSEGLTLDGYFLDCWPAHDRLQRIQQRTINSASWGPILDHGVGFIFDCYYHYIEYGNKNVLVEAFPRLLLFVNYIISLRNVQYLNGLVPVINLGIPCVWIDHTAFIQQEHKTCCWNIYIIGMIRIALIPLCKLFDCNEKLITTLRTVATELHTSVLQLFYDDTLNVLVDNKPFKVNDTEPHRYSDITLARAILFDILPSNSNTDFVERLLIQPSTYSNIIGLSYPANTCWRYWALGKLNRCDIIINEFVTIWTKWISVTTNNTLSEYPNPLPDSGDEWCHCPIVPVYILYMEIIGLRPLSPGYSTGAIIKPQLTGLPSITVTAYTPVGTVQFYCDDNTTTGTINDTGTVRHVIVTIPKDNWLTVHVAQYHTIVYNGTTLVAGQSILIEKAGTFEFDISSNIPQLSSCDY